MAKLSAEHKEEMSQYFEEGVHKVKIVGVVGGITTGMPGKEYIEFSVESEDGKQDNARLWFTTDGAMKYSFNIIKGIFVHNSTEDKKQKARDLLDKVEDTTELVKVCQALLGKEAWFTVSKSDTRTYTATDGTTKPSIDRNITGYEPKPKTITAAAPEPQAPLKTPEGSKDDVPFADGF